MGIKNNNYLPIFYRFLNVNLVMEGTSANFVGEKDKK